MNKISYIPPWSQINRMGKSRLLRSSYIWLFAVPMLAKLLAKIGPEVTFSLWGNTFTIIWGLPFSWQMFYFSAVGFSIASYIYSSWCPPIIRDYERFSDFTDQGKGSNQLREDFNKYCDFQNSAFKRLDHHIKRLLAKYRDLEISREDLGEIFWTIHSLANSTNTFARLLCWYAYMISFWIYLNCLSTKFHVCIEFSSKDNLHYTINTFVLYFTTLKNAMKFTLQLI